MNAERSRGDQLIDYLLSSGANDGQAANELLKECFRGYPVEKLIPLLRSNDSEAVKAGAFIVGEPATKAARSYATRARELAQPDFLFMSGLTHIEGVLAAHDGQLDRLAHPDARRDC